MSGDASQPGAGNDSGEFVPPSVEDLDAAMEQYDFIEILGRGGMGAVYKAKQNVLGRTVAIKILPHFDDDDGFRFAERFQREARAMAQMSHPNIVKVFDFGQTKDGQLFFVMEFIDGTDLHEVIRTGQLTTEHIHGWVPQICDGLFYAHSMGIIHRDIKPANIMITKDGMVKIADFGLAKLTETNEELTRLTMTNVAMGTPDYVAPEALAVDGEVDHRADIYAMGVMLYEMLTGTVPRGAFLPPSKKAGVDTRFDDIVQKAMDPDPATRLQQASEISTGLIEIQKNPEGTGPIQPRRQMVLKTVEGSPVARKKDAESRAPAPVPKSKASLYAGIAVVALAVLGGAAYLIWGRGGDDNSGTLISQSGAPDRRIETPEPQSPAPTPSNPAPAPAVAVAPSPSPSPAPDVPGVSSPAPTPEPSSPSPAPTPAPMPAGGIDLMEHVDLSINPVWQMKDGHFIQPTGDASGTFIPYRIREREYRIEMALKTSSSGRGNGFMMTFPSGDRRATLAFDMVEDDQSNRFTELLPKDLGAENPIRIKYPRPEMKIGHERLHHVTVGVSSSRLTLDFDGERLVDWSGPVDDWNWDWAPKYNGRDSRGMMTMRMYRPYEIHSLRLVPGPIPDSPLPSGSETSTATETLKIGGLNVSVYGGDWTFPGNSLDLALPEENERARAQLNLTPRQSYRLKVDFTRTGGDNDIILHLPVADTAVTLQLNSFGRFFGLSTVDGQRVEEGSNPTHREFLIENDRRYKLEVAIFNEGPVATIRASIDGENYFDWSGDRSRLAPVEDWKFPETGRLGIGSLSGARFFQIDVESIGGEPTPAPPTESAPAAGPLEFSFGELSGSPIGRELAKVQPTAVGRFQKEVVDPLKELNANYVGALQRNPQAESPAFQEEIALVESGRPVPAEDPPGFPAELTRLRATWRNAVSARNGPKQKAGEILRTAENVLKGLARRHTDEELAFEIEKARDALRPIYRHFELEEPPVVSNWVDLFNGTDLKGWTGGSGEFKIVDGVIRSGGKGDPLYFTGDDPGNPPKLQNFEFSVKAKTEFQGNSGIFIHCPFTPGAPNPDCYEIQIANENSDPRKSGSLWNIKDTERLMAKDGEWFELRVRVVGKRIQTFVDDKPVIDWTEPDNWSPPAAKPNARIGSGTIALQRNCTGKGVVSFKDIRIKRLPD